MQVVADTLHAFTDDLRIAFHQVPIRHCANVRNGSKADTKLFDINVISDDDQRGVVMTSMGRNAFATNSDLPANSGGQHPSQIVVDRADMNSREVFARVGEFAAVIQTDGTCQFKDEGTLPPVRIGKYPCRQPSRGNNARIPQGNAYTTGA